MVTVKVAVDHIPDRKLGNLVPDLPDQGFRGQGFRVGVDDQNVVAIDDDRRVAVQHRGRLRDRAVNAVCDLFEVEERGLSLAARRRLVVVSKRPDQRSQWRAARGRDKPSGRQSPQDLTASRLKIRSDHGLEPRSAVESAGCHDDGNVRRDGHENSTGTCRPSEVLQDKSGLQFVFAIEPSIPCEIAQHNRIWRARDLAGIISRSRGNARQRVTTLRGQAAMQPEEIGRWEIALAAGGEPTNCIEPAVSRHYRPIRNRRPTNPRRWGPG